MISRLSRKILCKNCRIRGGKARIAEFAAAKLSIYSIYRKMKFPFGIVALHGGVLVARRKEE